jgi:RNA polymerase sigma-70 factor (ECF subfamily)
VPSFEQFYETHFKFVWAMVRYYGVHPDYVPDVVQDAFLVVHSKLHTLHDPEAARSWLHGIVRRVASTHRRKRHEHRLVFGMRLEKFVDGDETRTPAERAAARQKLAQLSDILQSMHPAKRQVFVLCELEEFTCPEVAELLHLPLNTVYSRLRHAREAFERALAQKTKR